MKSLRRINLILKILKVICYVGLVLSIIGAVGIVVGLGILNVVKDLVVKDGKTVAMLLLEEHITINMAYTYMAIGLLSCLVSVALCYIMARFLNGVLKEGTPFTRQTVTKMRKLAIGYIIVSVAVSILCSIAITITKHLDPTVGKMNYSGDWNLGLALWVLFLSLFIEYPVEMHEENEKLEQEKLKPEDYVE